MFAGVKKVTSTLLDFSIIYKADEGAFEFRAFNSKIDLKTDDVMKTKIRRSE